MATASVEVSGPDAHGAARALVGELGPGVSVSAVEVDRSADLVVAVIGLVFSGVAAAKTIWDWWTARRSEGVKVRIVFEDGTVVDLAAVDQKQLEIELERRTGSDS
jgi:hypothetical protein